MAKKKFTLLHTDDTLELYCTLYPFLVSRLSKHIDFRYFPKLHNFNHHDNLLFTRIFKKRFDDHAFVNQTLNRLKESFQTVSFLDDSDGADSFHFEFIEHLDHYYKSKLPVDFRITEQPLYGRQIFSDYYHKQFGVDDGNEENIRSPLTDRSHLKKIKPAFNLGYGIYPLPASKSIYRKMTYAICRVHKLNYLKPYFLSEHKKLISKLSQRLELSGKELKISARFRCTGYPESISYQRKMFTNITSGHDAFLTGLIPINDFLTEMKNVLVTLSPFGFGEVCLRDFEAIINGSLLLKPDMSHITTYPDIYIPNETYVPVKWDGSDLIDKADDILSNPSSYYKIIEQARDVYRTALIDIDEKTEEFFAELLF